MVAMNTHGGLIVTTRKEPSAPLAELAAACGWPTLWAASARGLLRELSLQIPSCVLFWLDDRDGLAPTARLIEWLRERNAEPFRVAVACNAEAGTEALLRAAGAHTVLPVTGQSSAEIAQAIVPLLQPAAQRNGAPAADFISQLTTGDRASPLELAPELIRPP
jgi:hypothetical protein